MRESGNSGAPLIRPATEADGPAVREVVFGALREHGLTPDPEGTDRDLFELEAAYSGAGGAFAVLCTPDGAIVGTAGLHPCQACGESAAAGARGVELRKMYLKAEYRGRGWGSALLDWALDEARRRGFTRVRLETATVLGAAIRLYQRRGFRRVEACPGAGRCDWVMEREL